MNQYLLSIYQPEGEAPPREALESTMRNIEALLRDAKAAGVLVFNGGLYPPSAAKVVRLHRGGTLVTDGPFAETKEYIGGFFIIRVKDLDAALEWGRRAAQAITLDGVDGLPIEVRPFQSWPG